VTDYGHSQEEFDQGAVFVRAVVVDVAAAAVDVALPQPGTPPCTWLVTVLASYQQFWGLFRLP
jgi:hypothetical protein